MKTRDKGILYIIYEFAGISDSLQLHVQPNIRQGGSDQNYAAKLWFGANRYILRKSISSDLIVKVLKCAD